MQNYLEDRRRITEEFYASAGKVSCHKGCSNCCYQMVAITLADAWIIAAFVLSLPVDERTRAMSALQDAADAQQGEDHVSWLSKKVPCTFLQNTGACGIYGIRPLNCRQVLSKANPDFCAPENLVRLARNEATDGKPEIVPWNAMEPLFAVAQETMRALLASFGIEVDLTPAPLPMAVLAALYTMITGEGAALRSWAASTQPRLQSAHVQSQTLGTRHLPANA